MKEIGLRRAGNTKCEVTKIKSNVVKCRTQKILFWPDTSLLRPIHLLNGIFNKVHSISFSYGGYVVVHKSVPRKGIKREQFLRSTKEQM